MYPYKNTRQSGALSFTQGMLDSFMEYQKMRYMMGQQEIMNQYRRSLMGQHERSATLFQQKQLWETRKEAAFQIASPEEKKKYLLSTGPQVQIFTPGQTESVEEGITRMFAAAKDEEGKVPKEKALQIYDIAKQKYAVTVKDPNQFDAIFDSTAAGMGAYGPLTGEVEWNPQDADVRSRRPYFQYGPQLPEATTEEPAEKPGFFKGLWNKYTGSAAKAGIFAAQKIQGKPSKQELANIPTPNMNNPFVKGKPPAPEEALTWPPETQSEADKTYRDEIMRVWYSMPSLLQYEIWEALDAGKTYEEIIRTGKLEPWLR